MSLIDKIADLVVHRIEKSKNSKNEVSLDIANSKSIDKAKVKSDKQKAKEELALLRKKKQEEDKAIGEFIYEWRRLMSHLGLENKLDQTYYMSDIQVKSYGFKVKIYPYVGGTLSSLEEDKTKNAIQDHFRCIFSTKREMQTGLMEAQFITNQIPDVEFIPIKLKPWLLYLGTGIDGEIVTVDMLSYPHILDQGATNSGKSRLMDCIITNLIATESPEDVCFWILQCDKDDQAVYQKCKHVKGYAETLEEMDSMLNYLVEVVEYRKNIIKPLRQDGKASNIFTYNKVCKSLGLSKFNYQYIIVDEYPNIMPESGDDKYSKEIKTVIQNKIDRLIRIGRYVGLYFILGTQRSTIDKMPPFVRAMANTVITFRVNNMPSSMHAIDTDEALYLRQREAIFKTNEKIRLRTASISDETIFRYINPHKRSNAEYRNFNFDSWKTPEKENTKESKNKNGKKKNNENQEVSKENNTSQPERVPLGATYIGDIDKPSKDKKEQEEIKKIDEEPIKTITEEPKLEEKPVENINPDIITRRPKKTPFFIEDWKEPSEIYKVIDRTTISNSEIGYVKPKSKGDVDNDIEREG
jgi:S-DNA-T family DNA segregation ATPase FtsK/SpoIIIE